MYGSHTTAAAGGTAVLAYTGLNLGWYVTAALGLIFAGLALLQLVRRPHGVRP